MTSSTPAPALPQSNPTKKKIYLCRAWRSELQAALALGVPHISLYELTIEPGTKFHALQRRGKLALPTEDDLVAMVQINREETAAAGLRHYEISNYSRIGYECRHNLNYWHYGDYLPVGPGAHGRITLPTGQRLAIANIRQPRAWLEAVTQRTTPFPGAESVVPLAASECVEELLLAALRIPEGIPRSVFRDWSQDGQEFEAVLDAAGLQQLVATGLAECDSAGLRLTPAGLKVLDTAVLELVPV